MHMSCTCHVHMRVHMLCVACALRCVYAAHTQCTCIAHAGRAHAQDLPGAYSRAHAFLMIMLELTGGILLLVPFSLLKTVDPVEGQPTLWSFAWAGVRSRLVPAGPCWSLLVHAACMPRACRVHGVCMCLASTPCVPCVRARRAAGCSPSSSRRPSSRRRRAWQSIEHRPQTTDHGVQGSARQRTAAYRQCVQPEHAHCTRTAACTQAKASVDWDGIAPEPIFATVSVVSTIIFTWFCYEAYKLSCRCTARVACAACVPCASAYASRCRVATRSLHHHAHAMHTPCTRHAHAMHMHMPCRMKPDEYMKGVIYFYTDIFYVCACCALLACLGGGGGGGGGGGAPPRDEEER